MEGIQKIPKQKTKESINVLEHIKVLYRQVIITKCVYVGVYD